MAFLVKPNFSGSHGSELIYQEHWLENIEQADWKHLCKGNKFGATKDIHISTESI